MDVVTGATGRTGRAVVDGLIARGRQVRALGRDGLGLAPLVEAGADGRVVEPNDADALATVFEGAATAYVMVQPNYIPDSSNFRGHQRRIAEAMTSALRAAAVPRVVTLSSWGADQPTGTGPVAGLHELEQRTSTLDAAVTHLRAGYFMENLLGQVASIRTDGCVRAPFDPDVPLPFIAAKDVGRAAAQSLVEPTSASPGRPEVRELHGERDLSLREATSLIAQVTGMPDLRYVQQSLEEFAADQRAAGVSGHVTALMVEVAVAINTGHTATRQERSAWTTTPTSLESFLTSTLVPELESGRST